MSSSLQIDTKRVWILGLLLSNDSFIGRLPICLCKFPGLTHFESLLIFNN